MGDSNMPIYAVLLSNLLHPPPEMSLYVAIDALPMPDTMNYHRCPLTGGRFSMCTNTVPLLCGDLLVCLFGAEFSFLALLSQFFLLDFCIYAACFQYLVHLLVAPLEGSIIDHASGTLAWPRKSLDTIQI